VLINNSFNFMKNKAIKPRERERERALAIERN
jgi:hypothetical protein